MDAPQETVSRRTWWVWWAIALVWWSLDGFTTATNYHRMGQSSATGLTWEQAFRMALVSAWLWVPLTVLA
ncbi:MAG: hypothetical protein M3434_13195, partial [Gemmatimonadota bacterium]|nr:hypothetical protein [Gemmatimonadota bacterium]